MDKMCGFHYLPCPLCQHNVDESQPDDFHALPLDPSLVKPLSRRNWQWLTEVKMISNGKFRSGRLQSYPTVKYQTRVLLFHRRCFDFIKDLSHLQIYLLIDVVEPTFLDRSLPPVSKFGAFSLDSSKLPSPRWTKPHLFRRLPPEIQDMVFEHGLRRLLFVIRASCQIDARNEELKSIPERRFTQEILFLKDDILRIHRINIGGQIYISYLSSIAGKAQSGMETQEDYDLNRSDYLAVKSDGVGVIDIALRATDTGPKWILGNYSSRQFPTEISIIRCADIRQLRIIRDTLKCRAIIPLNRAGAEPYFQSPRSPPQDSWVDSSFYIETQLSIHDDPFAYFTRATYIPFDTMKNLTFDIHPGRLGIYEIAANDPNPPKWKTSIDFEDPPTKLRFFVCGVSIGTIHTFRYPFFQFMINGHWQPPLPHQSTVLVLRGPILVESVLGIWWGDPFHGLTPTHIGIVVSNRSALKNTVL